MIFPITDEDFAEMERQGKNIEYIDTTSSMDVPDGEGWEYWSNRTDDNGTVAVWRRIVSIT